MKEPKHVDFPNGALMAEKQALLYNARLKMMREAKVDKQEHAYRIVAVGREVGSLGNEVPSSLAEETGWHLLDREIVQYIAKNNHVREQIVQELDEKKQNLAHDYVERLLHMAIGQQFFGEEEYHLALVKTLATLAAHGQVVFVGHGSTFAFTDPWCLRLRITASPEVRVKRLCERWHVSEEKALKNMKDTDNEMQEFVRLHFGKSRDRMIAYDLIFSTDHLSVRNVVDAVLAAMKGGKK
jgi:hypothetical protein